MIKYIFGSLVIIIGAGMIGYSADGITGALFCAGAAMIFSVVYYD